MSQTLRRLENKRKPEEEEAERRKRQRKNDKERHAAPVHQAKLMDARDTQICELKEADSTGQRRKLVLPSALVGEFEPEDVVKIGQAGENAKVLVSGRSDARGKLLSDYQGLETARISRTPRTTPRRNYTFMLGSPSSPHLLKQLIM